MIIRCLNRFFKDLKFTNQILMIQVITIMIIIIMLFTLCYFLMIQFESYIKDELVESVIQKSIISSIHLIVGESMQLFLISYNYYANQAYFFIDLYYFQVMQNIQMDVQLEECQNAVYLNSYQYCYNGSNKTDTNQIKQYIAFQNQIIPFKQDIQNLGFYNMLVDDQFSFAHQVGKQKPKFDANIYDAYLQMKNYDLPYYLKYIQNGEQSIAYYFSLIPYTKIAIGTSYDQNQQPFIKLSRSPELQFRTFILLENGYILEDSESLTTGMYFQNQTGFTNMQFEAIVNYSHGLKIQNECESKLQNCLRNNNTEEKLIYSYQLLTGSLQIVIFMQDASKINQIRADINKQFQDFFKTQILQIMITLSGILILCLAIQCLLVITLSRPLLKLEQIAQYNMNTNQFLYLRIIRKNKIDQIQKLQDSYYDLINLKHQQHHNNKSLFMNHEFIHQSGKIQILQQQRDIRRLKFDIQQSIK